MPQNTLTGPRVFVLSDVTHFVPETSPFNDRFFGPFWRWFAIHRIEKFETGQLGNHLVTVRDRYR